MNGSVVPGTLSVDLAITAEIDDVAGLFADAHDDLFASLPWFRCSKGAIEATEALLMEFNATTTHLVDRRRRIGVSA